MKTNSLPIALNNSTIAALITFFLALPLVGLAFDSGSLIFRWQWVAIGVVGVFVINLLWRTIRLPVRTGAVLAFFALACIFPFYADRGWLDLATLVLIYVVLAWGLNITVGYAGLLDLGYVAFYAIGAYSYGLIATELGWSFWWVLPLSGLIAAAFAGVVGLPILRLRGDYLAIVTLAFAEIIRITINNWQNLTGGPNGITQIPRPTLFGLEFNEAGKHSGKPFHEAFNLPYMTEYRLIFAYFIILGLAALVYLASRRLRKLPLGRVWEAMREDEIACRALGINIARVKLSAYMLGASVAGLVGCFFAAKQGYISPESFTFMETAIVLAIVVLGGMGSQAGILVAAILLVLVPELSRAFAEYRMLFFGMVMVAIMVFRPGGLVANREATITLLHDEPQDIEREPKVAGGVAP